MRKKHILPTNRFLLTSNAGFSAFSEQEREQNKPDPRVAIAFENTGIKESI